MATSVENWDYINEKDDLQHFSFSETNHNILMSLLDETQVEYSDDKRLTDVIRSLEAEIKRDDATPASGLMDIQSSNVESNVVIPSDDLENTYWQEFEAMLCSPGCYIDQQHEQWKYDGSEFGDKNYASVCLPVIEQDNSASLWHDINVTVINSSS